MELPIKNNINKKTVFTICSFTVLLLIFYLFIKVNASIKYKSKIADVEYFTLKTNLNNNNLIKIFENNNINDPEKIKEGITKDIKILNIKPLIFTVDNFISEEECNHFVNISKNRKFERGKVHNDYTNEFSNARTNSLMWITHDNDEIVGSVCNRISKLINVPIERAESVQLINYQETQKYEYHYDAFDKESKEWNNQRLYTTLVYLNEVEEGGETSFQKLGIDVKPKKGTLIFFKNCLDDQKTRDLDSLHAGKAVLKGEKFAFNLWFHEKNYKDFQN